MTDNNKLLFLCEKFIKKEYGLIEFQSRMGTANFPEHLSDFQDEIINQLEIIQFTEKEIDYYRKTLVVIEELKNLLK
ncbi:hypothetical protein MPH47_20855 [Psychrobacillus psychrodurans]|uniref:hypothetical protein n=1 Tax=Bacillaceae TaxID=186817 RepID=UPI001F4DA590|nr:MULTISPECIES: hypothetical protein [Bacillaceae]MCK1999641.1 hypothetical protein [Psychrobacillus psychrodurans]MDF2066536.1 hypothetical protein [Bacillus sp. Cr_A10]